MSPDEVGDAGRRVFVYEVKLCKADGSRGSGWSVEVVTDSPDPVALLRTARVAAAAELYGADDWVGIDEVKLLTTAVLDPRIA